MKYSQDQFGHTNEESVILAERNPASKAQHLTEDNELAALIELCQSGNKQAFSKLYQRTSARLNGIAYRITRNVDSANDVLQEAFIQIWQNCEHYQVNKSGAFTWLSSIVRYRAYDRLRYEKRRHYKDNVQFNEMELSTHQLADINQHSQCLGLEKQNEKMLNNCLSKLEQNQSQSILMAYLYGYSRQDIAHYFDKPINTIKSWIRRGLGRLKLCLNS